MADSPIFEALGRLSPTVSVGLLAADLLNLGSEISLLEKTAVGMLHFDVMDGCFCPMMTAGPPFIKAAKTSLLKDVHLMIENPLEKVADYVSAGADIVTMHIESEPAHIHRVLQSLGKMTNANDPAIGIIRGIALNPGTPVEAAEPLLDKVEMVTLLAINPGWSGQRFLECTYQRAKQMREMISGRDILLCIDGGITRDNIFDVAKLRADVVVTGSAIFDGNAVLENTEFMLAAVRGQQEEGNGKQVVGR